MFNKLFKFIMLQQNSSLIIKLLLSGLTNPVIYRDTRSSFHCRQPKVHNYQLQATCIFSFSQSREIYSFQLSSQSNNLCRKMYYSLWRELIPAILATFCLPVTIANSVAFFLHIEICSFKLGVIQCRYFSCATCPLTQAKQWQHLRLPKC